MKTKRRNIGALTILGVVAVISLCAMMVRPGIGQVEQKENKPTDIPGVTKQANTLFFVGKIASLDKEELTVVLGDTNQETFRVTSNTEILLDGKPAKLSDLHPTDVVKVVSDIGHRNRAEKIVVARVDRTVESTAASAATGESTATMRGRRGAAGNLPVWQGKLFVAPLQPQSVAAQAGLRPGDLILLVEPGTALNADTTLQGLRIQPTLNTPVILVDPNLVGGVVPGQVGGVVVPGQVGGVVPGQVGVGVAVPVTPFGTNVPAGTVQTPSPATQPTQGKGATNRPVRPRQNVVPNP